MQKNEFPGTVFAACLLCAGAVSADEASVFGYKFGEEVVLPTCPDKSPISEYIDSDCRFVSKYDNDPNVVIVYVPKSDTPIYMKGQIDLYTINGVTQAAHYLTWGESAQRLILGELKKKYGHPTKQGADVMQNSYGAKFTKINAFWILKNVTVRFRGFRDANRDAGDVWVYTKEGASHSEIVKEFSSNAKGRAM